nr:DUF3164 family protein [uncultured Sphaerochaeta sp.]
MEDYKQTMNGTEYWLDQRGSLVPAEKIGELDKLRDDVVREMLGVALPLSDALRKAKASVYSTLDTFLAMSSEQYGVKRKGTKGNVTLLTFDGRYKVALCYNDVFAFDERLQTAKELIDSCLIRWADGASANLVAVVKEAFRVDKKGKLDVRRILELRRYEIHDEQWQQAMEAISDSITVQNTRRYVRFYERHGEDEWRQVALDWSSITG